MVLWIHVASAHVAMLIRDSSMEFAKAFILTSSEDLHDSRRRILAGWLLSGRRETGNVHGLTLWSTLYYSCSEMELQHFIQR